VDNAFESVQRTPRGHFLLHFYGAILRLITYVERSGALKANEQGGSQPEGGYRFLQHYREEVQRFLPQDLPLEKAVFWWEAQITDWQQGIDGHLPLAALEDLPAVGSAGRAVFMLAGLVEEDSRFGTLLSLLQQPLSARRLTLGLVSTLLIPDGQQADIDAWDTCRGLLSMGALETANFSVPRSEWMMHVPSPVWDAARASLKESNGSWYRLHPPTALPSLDDLVLTPEIVEQLCQVPSVLAEGAVRCLILRGTAGSDRFRVGGAVVAAMGRQLIEVLPCGTTAEAGDGQPGDERRVRSLGVLCTLANALPLYTFDLSPGETATLPELPGYSGPIIALLGSEGGLRGSVAERALALSLPQPDLALRLQLWQASLGDRAVALEHIAASFILPAGYIRQVAPMAIAQAGLHGRDQVNLEDVRRATRALNRQILDTLAGRVETSGAWSQLVVGAGTLAKLHELERRCHYRERLLDRLGPAFGSTANRGVRALFSGTSGTGKTLAARILAAELGMDLYRVDLASVINKYIGETEKNLHRVLSRAEELDIILLLDEGDSLLSQRTNVKSSNDRYANLETNYLLQRLEHYQGIVLITTNAAQNIDTAFQRRMDVVVDFVPPQADERWLIWQLHLPASHAVSPDFLNRVAAQCVLTGGQIRNAALLATMLAIGDDSEIVHNQHVVEGVRAEYRKAGAVYPVTGGNGLPKGRYPLDDFIHMLT
jgi:hypothetical protein